MVSDAELLQGCQRQDARAQTAFYERFKGRLMGVCRRYARSQAETEDMFQEGFVRIFQQLHTLQQPEKLLPWMKRVMVNTAINVYHRNHRQQAETDYEAAYDLATDDHLDTLSRLSANELLIMIDALPPGYRMVFNLYVIDGYTHPDIAEMLGVAEGTSKSQLARAKSILKQKLSKLGIVSYETA